MSRKSYSHSVGREMPLLWACREKPNDQNWATATGGWLTSAIWTLKFHNSTEISRGVGCWLQRGVKSIGAKKYRSMTSLFKSWQIHNNRSSGIALWIFEFRVESKKFDNVWTIRFSCPHLGVFIDARRVLPNETKYYGIARLGMRVAF